MRQQIIFFLILDGSILVSEGAVNNFTKGQDLKVGLENDGFIMIKAWR